MKPITSIYIPRIEGEIDATFIADVLEKNGIAQVSSIYIEPYKSDIYNRAYIGIKFWHDTESAFNFIVQLRNTSREARLVYNDDNWWPVYINKSPAKLASSTRVLTLFEEKHVEFYNDDISTTAPPPAAQPLDMIKVDLEKTNLLRNILNTNLRTTAPLEPLPLDMIKVDLEKTKLLRNMAANFQLDLNYKRQLEFTICDAADFDKYSREIDDDQKKWFAENNWYYALC